MTSMELISPPRGPRKGPELMDRLAPHRQRISALLYGEDVGSPLLDLVELSAALNSLATLKHRKRLLPLADHPVEIALVRDGDTIEVSRYESGGFKEPDLLNHLASLKALLAACTDAVLARADAEEDPTARQIALRVAERAMRTRIEPDRAGRGSKKIQGGVDPEELDEIKLGFRFEATLPVLQETLPRTTNFSDAHALLFTGKLVAYIHGKKVRLAEGPISLAIERMVRAVQHLVDARDEGRSIRKRIVTDSFGIEVRSPKPDAISLSFASIHSEPITISELDLGEAAIPILSLASDFMRAITSADRSQRKNLLIRHLREEIRELRKRIRLPRRGRSFENDDPESLRLSLRVPARKVKQHAAIGAHAPPRFSERYSITLDGLDIDSVFLVGDQLIVGAEANTLALAREDGRVLWAREARGHRLTLAHDRIVREAITGDIDVCQLEDGDTVFEYESSAMERPAHRPLIATGTAFPPTAIVSEAVDRLVALDLRTGERRFRFVSRTRKLIHFTVAARLLVVADEDGSVHGIDLATGEIVWRFSADTSFKEAPIVAEDTVLARAVGGEDGRGSIYAIDLFRGNLLYRLPIEGHLRGTPMSHQGILLLVVRKGGEPLIRAFDLRSGDERYEIDDPGISSGAGATTHEGRLYVHGAWGELTAIQIDDGSTLYRTEISAGEGDELPHDLRPIVHGSVILLPGNSVTMIRAEDGFPLRASIPTELIPDKLLVGENGWIYIVEASGQLEAYAPIPHLSLVRGGGR